MRHLPTPPRRQPPARWPPLRRLCGRLRAWRFFSPPPGLPPPQRAQQLLPAADEAQEAIGQEVSTGPAGGGHVATDRPPPLAAPAEAEWPEGTSAVMLRNVPNRYTPEELLTEFINHRFERAFDFFMSLSISEQKRIKVTPS